MYKILIMAVAAILLLPSLSLSKTSAETDSSDNHYRGILEFKSPYMTYEDSQGKTTSIKFKHFESGPMVLPEDKKSRYMKEQRQNFNALTTSYSSSQNTPQPFVGNLSIDPYFGENKKSLKSSVFELPSNLGELLITGVAFLTNMAAHEFGHALVGEHVGASGNTVNFFDKQGGQFFLGMSSVKSIKAESKLPYTMGGEFFADLTFEHALKSYRKKPNFYNTSLLLYSGTDFLWYCIYAFYLSDGHSGFDPNTISRETGLSEDELFSIVLAKTIINTYRIYSGQDRVIPYFSVNSSSAALNLSVPF